MTYVVYAHINNTNYKVYIGMTCRKLYNRFGKCGVGYKECPKFWNAIQKYGWYNFSHCIIMSNLSKCEAESLEKEWISLFRSNDDRFGYNIGLGGDGSNNLSIEARDKIRKSKMGSKNPNYGKRLSNEHKAKLCASRSMLGKHHTQEAKKKMSVGHKGKNCGEHHPRSKKVRCIETDEVYFSVGEASRSVGISRWGIAACCRGEQKALNGLRWEFV